MKHDATAKDSGYCCICKNSLPFKDLIQFSFKIKRSNNLVLSRQGTFAFSLIKYTPLKYNNEYVYPWWGYALGWLLALSSMVCIPLWIVYKMSMAKGSLREVSDANITSEIKVKCIAFWDTVC